jgi:hypothetical protein
MEIIDEQLKNLPQNDLPVEVHQSIMRTANYRRVRPMLFIGFFLLAINFLIIAWHINAKLVDAEFSDMIADFFEGFDLSFLFVKTILVATFEIVPIELFLSGLASLLGAMYIGIKIKSLEFPQTKTALR